MWISYGIIYKMFRTRMIGKPEAELQRKMTNHLNENIFFLVKVILVHFSKNFNLVLER